MSKLGSGDNGEFTFLDMISIISFAIGLQNLNINISQEDVDERVEDLHNHLAKQDEKLNMIIKQLEELKNA